MADLPIDFQCYVGAYEIRRLDELRLEPSMNPVNAPEMPCLVATGTPKLVRPKRSDMDTAVGLLLKTEMPKWVATQSRIGNFLSSLANRRGHNSAPDIEKLRRSVELDRDEFTLLERNTLSIARQLGMLRSRVDLSKTHKGRRHEPLYVWSLLADRIQTMFGNARLSKRDFEESVGSLGLFISYNSGNLPSLHIRPHDTFAALIYHAAQMIAGGTAFQTCVQCGTPFLGGGTGRGAKRRGDARFCSDKCRWTHHNEARKKSKS